MHVEHKGFLERAGMEQPEKKSPRGRWAMVKKRDVLWLALILALAALAWLVLGRVFAGSGRPGATALVTVGYGESQRHMEIALDEARIVEIKDALLPVTLQVEPGGIRFIQSVCPDHICENEGWLRRDGERAVCMPAGVVVQVRGTAVPQQANAEFAPNLQNLHCLRRVLPERLLPSTKS